VRVEAVPATDARPRAVEPVVAPPPGNPRFPLFDSLRAIAALSVLMTHTALVAGANQHAWYGKYTARLDLGVTIFFLISGFLLYRPYVAARLDGRRPPRIRDFARRRVLRIVPAYWLALTILAIYPGLYGMWTGHSWAYYLFGQIYERTWTLGGIGPAWSLCIEISFYAVLPFFALFLRRVRAGASREAKVRSELLALAALFAASVLIRATTAGSQVQVMLPAAFDWFALGMLLAVASAALAGREPAPIRLIRNFPSVSWLIALVLFWYVATQLGLGGGAFAQLTDYQNVAEHLLYGAIAFFLLLPAVFADDGGGLPRAILRNRVLSWLGLISYGIFLWHATIAAHLSVVRDGRLFEDSRMLGLTSATVAIAVACAAASYYLLERPILTFKDRPFGRLGSLRGGRRARRARRSRAAEAQ
jgi:peptidoglycan/LPS O-acetylase OafA/YrhL